MNIEVLHIFTEFKEVLNIYIYIYIYIIIFIQNDLNKNILQHF